MKELDFVLSEPLTMHVKGNVDQVDTLIMRAPSSGMMDFAAPLKQMFFGGINKLRAQSPQVADANSASEDAMTADTALMVLYMGDCDIVKFIENFKRLILAGAIKANNGEKLTSVLIDKLSAEDFERLMGEYLVNFIVGSLFSRAGKN